MNIKRRLVSNFESILGWRTNRHILVIESDDWGSIRMPSHEVYKKLLNAGVRFGNAGYEEYDTIASCDDLECLFEACSSFRDINGRPLVITANAVVANPDFDKIKESGYKEYYYEPITTTMQRYYPEKSPFILWKEGMERGVFRPQLHGREHVNVSMWMNSLRKGHIGAREAFDEGVFAICVLPEEDGRVRNTEALNYQNTSEFEVVKKSLVEASGMFDKMFGYKSKSFIAPSFKWDSAVESILNEIGVKYIQGLYKHTDNGQVKYNYIGKRNNNGQIYLNRSCHFEYSQLPNTNWIEECLKSMEIAYRWHKPFTINMHRLNFVGALDVNNRVNNLQRLKRFVTLAQKRWPDIEFMASDELGDIISAE